jgi:dihydrofolate reductase
MRPVGTYLYGRRMYETMIAWENPNTPGFESPIMQDFAALWKAADKIVYSKTLQNIRSAGTRVERDFEPDVVEKMKAASERDLLVGGPELAAHAFNAGLVDECHLFVTPILVGGGKQALPDDVHLTLELLDEHRFDSGIVFLRYGTTWTKPTD